MDFSRCFRPRCFHPFFLVVYVLAFFVPSLHFEEQLDFILYLYQLY